MSREQRKIALPKKQRAKLRFGKHALIFLILFGLYCFGNVWQNVSIAHLNRQNERLRKELKSLQHACNDLALQAEQLKDPERIMKVLSSRVELQPVEKVNIKKNYQ